MLIAPGFEHRGRVPGNVQGQVVESRENDVMDIRKAHGPRSPVRLKEFMYFPERDTVSSHRYPNCL